MITRKFTHRRWYAIAALLVATACLMVSMIVSPRVHTATTEALPALGENAMPTLEGEEAVNYLKQQGLHSSLGEAMAAARYGVHWSEHTPWKELPGAFYAGNPAQQMRAFFSAEGIHLEAQSASQNKAQSASENKWRMGMRLTGLGYGERLLRVVAGEMKVNGNRVEIEKRVERQASSGKRQVLSGKRQAVRV